MTEEELNKLDEIVLNYKTLRHDKEFCNYLLETLTEIVKEYDEDPIRYPINIEIENPTKKIPPTKFYNQQTKKDFIRLLISWLLDRINAIDEEIKKL